eukprot:5530748-Pyramimonas_sp.AAC.1
MRVRVDPFIVNYRRSAIVCAWLTVPSIPALNNNYPSLNNNYPSRIRFGLHGLNMNMVGAHKQSVGEQVSSPVVILQASRTFKGLMAVLSPTLFVPLGTRSAWKLSRWRAYALSYNLSTSFRT